MDRQQAALTTGRTNLALATLFLGTFVLGSAELLVVGVLKLIAADLQDQTLRQAVRGLPAA